MHPRQISPTVRALIGFAALLDALDQRERASAVLGEALELIRASADGRDDVLAELFDALDAHRDTEAVLAVAALLEAGAQLPTTTRKVMLKRARVGDVTGVAAILERATDWQSRTELLWRALDVSVERGEAANAHAIETLLLPLARALPLPLPGRRR